MSTATAQNAFSSRFSAGAKCHQKRAAAAPLRARRQAPQRRVVIVYVAAAGGHPVAAAGGTKTNVLVVGGGGREHALCWRLRMAPTCGDLFCTPGNAGIAGEPGVSMVDVDETDHAAVIAFCRDNNIGATFP